MKFGKKERVLLIVGISIMIIIVLISIIINQAQKKYDLKDLPYETDDALITNKEINYIYNTYKKDDNEVTTTTNKSNGLYSILITVKTKSDLGNYLIPKYFSFVYSIKDETTLSNEELANLYNYDIDEIENKITERFEEWYNSETEIGYVDKNECDLKCYFSFYRNIKNLKDNYTLYVKNNKLYIYISFDKNSYCEDIDFFDNLNYDPYIIEL